MRPTNGVRLRYADGHHSHLGDLMTAPAPYAPADQPAAQPQNNGVGLAALIVGGVAFLFAIVPVLSFIAWLPALAAIILGIVGLVRKGRKKLFAGLGLGLGVFAWIVAIIVSVVTGLGAIVAAGDAVESAAPMVTSEPVEEEVVEEPATEEPVEEVVEEPAAPEMSVSQQNAVEQADRYLSVMPFSRQGLIDQLVYEEYPEADAVFAVDYIGADWNAQAAAKAASYLDVMSFSRQGLIDQLVFDGFSAEQAEFGVNSVGL